ncbi:antitoxin Xre/MbcA/ParS toxin-binding domain-containing protein [Pseudomonas sp. NPDC087626]|uniref:type II RES/Xre toxin-antitoxin system antitoxin n=1 Tax=Pseudomonas sp. NPDC087626 TaxID=3364444 RepID=UPI0037FCEF15
MKTSVASTQCLTNAFWHFSAQTHEQKESERLQQIKSGVSVDLVDAIHVAFNLSDAHLAILFNTSLTTLKRRKQQQKPLDSIASERLDRIASVCQKAQEVFESRVAATRWMSAPNQSLGHSIPVMLCVTEIGANQVRRVLHALEWGGVV